MTSSDGDGMGAGAGAGASADEARVQGRAGRTELDRIFLRLERTRSEMEDRFRAGEGVAMQERPHARLWRTRVNADASRRAVLGAEGMTCQLDAVRKKSDRSSTHSSSSRNISSAGTRVCAGRTASSIITRFCRLFGVLRVCVFARRSCPTAAKLVADSKRPWTWARVKRERGDERRWTMIERDSACEGKETAALRRGADVLREGREVE